MKRYIIEMNTVSHGTIARMVEHPTGRYVTFDDHAAKVTRLENELTACQLERDRLVSEMREVNRWVAGLVDQARAVLGSRSVSRE